MFTQHKTVMKRVSYQGCKLTMKKYFIINSVMNTEHCANSGISNGIKLMFRSLIKRDFSEVSRSEIETQKPDWKSIFIIQFSKPIIYSCFYIYNRLCVIEINNAYLEKISRHIAAKNCSVLYIYIPFTQFSVEKSKFKADFGPVIHNKCSLCIYETVLNQ